MSLARPLSFGARIRTSVVAVVVAGALLALPACASPTSSGASAPVSGAAVAAATVSPTSSADRVKLAKTRFVLNAGLAAGATYQWIYKPFKAGTFKKGAKGRTAAVIKGALAAAFTYNRAKAALNDAKGDPTLSKATTALSNTVDNLKNLPSKIRNGSASDADYNQFTSVTDSIKQAGASAGAPVTDQVPSAGQLTQMVNS
ncbi:hypothetical protein [Streptacidiphilus anmyonensis]|uniref:hypothetical protein n=1 Tax=Streptacidiphilus anmyonensis TaxID=405782 RepID=UPI000ACB3FAD|nr:hypothetical protein [Streptacidiphilus anmyonensis]